MAKKVKKKKIKKTADEKKKDIVKFIGFFVISIILLYLLYYYLLRYTLLTPLKSGTAFIIAGFLGLLGFETSVNGNVVSFNGFAMEIIDECTGVFSSIVYSSAVIAYPTNLKYKIVGIIFGVLMLYTFNLFRLIILAVVGVVNPEMFQYLHVYLWQVTFIAFIIAVFVAWIFMVRKYAKA